MMKKLILIILTFFITSTSVIAQKGIDFSHTYVSGDKLSMCVDSAAKNVYYANKFPNQPNTTFNYLPNANNISFRVHFRKKDTIEHYRYTILVDNKPIVVNRSIKKEQIKSINRGGDELFRFATLGIFQIKGKIITTLVYSIEKPFDIDKSIYYGKPIPKAKIKFFSKLFQQDGGFASHTDLNVRTNFRFITKDKELVIVKDKSDIDYLYYTSIKDKRTNKIIFKSTAWEYGHFTDSKGYLPHIRIDKNVFKKSGDYEIIIQPYIKWNLSPKEKEKHITRHEISITLDEENYSKKDLIIFGLIICAIFGAICGATLTYIKKKEARKVAQQFEEKEIAKLKLNSIRSQLSPHFLFNALSGIQNLMNKNEIDNANKYLSKFARLTRNVLDDKELISLSQEKTLLDDYLQMEQLRFGFKYDINLSENLDLANIEIPSMLLQPFVENSVKHGVSQKAIDGKISITFTEQANNLVLTVSDDGNGFDTRKKYSGFGIALSENRIALLNSIYKENRFILDIESTNAGTITNLTLTDWLS